MKRKEKNFTQLFKQAFSKKNQPPPEDQSLQDSFSAVKSDFTPVLEQEEHSLKSQKIMTLLNFLCQEIKNLGQVIKSKPAQQICALKMQMQPQSLRTTRLADLQISLQEMNLKFQKLNDGYVKNVAQTITLISSKKDLEGQLEVQRSRVKELNKRQCQLLLQQQRLQCQIFLKDERIQSYSKALSELQQQLQKALIRQSRQEFQKKGGERGYSSVRESGFGPELSQIGTLQSFSLGTTGIDEPMLQRINLVKQIQNLTTQLTHSQLKFDKELRLRTDQIASLSHELHLLHAQNHTLSLQLQRLLELRHSTQSKSAAIQTDEWEGLSKASLDRQLRQLREETAAGLRQVSAQVQNLGREGKLSRDWQRESLQQEMQLLLQLTQHQQTNNKILQQILLKLTSPPFSEQANTLQQLRLQIDSLFGLHHSLLQTGSLSLNHLRTLHEKISCVQDCQQQNQKTLSNSAKEIKCLFLKNRQCCNCQSKTLWHNRVLQKRLKNLTKRHSSLLRKGVERWNNNHYQRLIRDALSKCKVLCQDSQQIM